MPDEWVLGPDDGVAAWVVIDENRGERTIWGPFATEPEADEWQDKLIAEYEAEPVPHDEERPADWIDTSPIFLPTSHKPAVWHCPGEDSDHWSEHVEELPDGRFRVHCGECGRDSYTEENPT